MKSKAGGRARLRTDFAFKVLAWRVARHSSDQSDQRPPVPFATCRNRYRRSCPSAAARRRMGLGLMNRPAAIEDILEFTSAQGDAATGAGNSSPLYAKASAFHKRVGC